MLTRRSTSTQGSKGADSEEPPTVIGSGVIAGSDEPDPRRLGGLVLARRLAEIVLIGDEVELQVVGLKINAVRLMLTAPLSIPIHRLEVFQAHRSARRLESSVVPEAKDGPCPPKGRGKLGYVGKVPSPHAI